jgi:hypothetical protein
VPLADVLVAVRRIPNPAAVVVNARLACNAAAGGVYLTRSRANAYAGYSSPVAY